MSKEFVLELSLRKHCPTCGMPIMCRVQSMYYEHQKKELFLKNVEIGINDIEAKIAKFKCPECNHLPRKATALEPIFGVL